MNIISYPKAKFEVDKLILDDNTNIDEWREVGKSLKQVEGSVQFWIADWIRFGNEKGFTGKKVDSKTYDQLQEATGLQRQTLKNINSVAEKVPTSVRRKELTFSHHAEVTDLEPEEQKTFLDQAAEEKLSVRQLRERVKESQQPETNSHPAVEMPAPVAPVTPARELSFGHYRLIDDLPDHLKEMITQKILVENMSVEDLKKEMERSAPPRKFDLTHIRRIQNQDEWEDILRGLVYHINIYCTDDQRGYLLENISI